jgi:hypothetical protein
LFPELISFLIFVVDQGGIGAEIRGQTVPKPRPGKSHLPRRNDTPGMNPFNSRIAINQRLHLLNNPGDSA